MGRPPVTARRPDSCHLSQDSVRLDHATQQNRIVRAQMLSDDTHAELIKAGEAVQFGCAEVASSTSRSSSSGVKLQDCRRAPALRLGPVKQRA